MGSSITHGRLVVLAALVVALLVGMTGSPAIAKTDSSVKTSKAPTYKVSKRCKVEARLSPDDVQLGKGWNVLKLKVVPIMDESGNQVSWKATAKVRMYDQNHHRIRCVKLCSASVSVMRNVGGSLPITMTMLSPHKAEAVFPYNPYDAPGIGATAMRLVKRLVPVP